MPSADLRPGFFGKIPATGDFVTRRLPGDFVRFWDPFAARHLVPLLTAETWDAKLGLNFMLGDDAATASPMAGVVLPSADRIGRQFPLTVAAPLRFPSMGMPVAAADWFSAIHATALGATAGEVGADRLADQLAELPFPSDGLPGAPVRALVLWTEPSRPIDVEPAAPGAALERLLAFGREVG